MSDPITENVVYVSLSVKRQALLVLTEPISRSTSAARAISDYQPGQINSPTRREDL